MKTIMKLIILFTVSTVFSSCYDKVELEDRGFIVAIGIDKYNEKTDKEVASFDGEDKGNRFTISMSLPDIDSIINTSSGDNSVAMVKVASGKTILEAQEIINSHSSHKIYLGHTKLVVLGKEILSDETLFNESLDYIERSNEINNKILVVATQKNAKDILEGKIKDKTMPGIFVNNFYKNNKNVPALSFKLDLYTLLLKLRENGDVLIPEIEIENEYLKLSGCAIIKEEKLVGWLNDTEMVGYLWVKGDADNTTLISPYKENYTSVKVYKNKTKLKFIENGNNLVCQADIYAKGDLKEFNSKNENITDNEILKEIGQLYENIIQERIYTTWNSFSEKHEVDGFNLKNLLMKKNYELYKKYEANWNDTLKNMELKANITVDITGTGSVQ
jgi:spore germination protein KC